MIGLMPAPLSWISISKGRLTRAPLPGTDRRTPGRNAVRNTMRPPTSPSSAMASAAFLTRLRQRLDRACRDCRGRAAARDRTPGGSRCRGRSRIWADLAHVIEHVVNVDRLDADRALVAEDLHAVDQFADAVGLRADQLGQGAVFIGQLRVRAVGRRRGCRTAGS